MDPKFLTFSTFFSSFSRACARCCAEHGCWRVISVIPEGVRVTSRVSRSSRQHLRLLTGGALPRQRFVRDSGTCSCDVTQTTLWRATVAHSYVRVFALWLMHRKRGEGNDTHVCKRGNLTLRGSE